MSTHTVPKDTNPRPIDLLESVKDRLGELLRDVAVHFVALGPRFLGRVDVEAGAGAEVVGVVFALDFQSTCWVFKEKVNIIRATWLESVVEGIIAMVRRV